MSTENERPSVSTRPMSSAATNAPRIEPMPPMTMTTKARISTVSPIPGSTDRIGAIMMPAKPASIAPKPNTIMNKRRILTPSADTIAALFAPARTSMPIRVCATTTYSSTATRSPEAITTSRHTG